MATLMEHGAYCTRRVLRYSIRPRQPGSGCRRRTDYLAMPAPPLAGIAAPVVLGVVGTVAAAGIAAARFARRSAAFCLRASLRAARCSAVIGLAFFRLGCDEVPGVGTSVLPRAMLPLALRSALTSARLVLLAGMPAVGLSWNWLTLSALAALAPALTSARDGLADGLVAAGAWAKADSIAACARGIANSVSIFFILGVQSLCVGRNDKRCHR